MSDMDGKKFTVKTQDKNKYIFKNSLQLNFFDFIQGYVI